MSAQLAYSNTPSSAFGINTNDPESMWTHAWQIQMHGITRPLNLINFWGKVYPVLQDEIMVGLLGINPGDRVVDVGGGDTPFARADVVTDAFPDNGAHRSGRTLGNNGSVKPFVECFAEELPFADQEFDFAYCRTVLEHVVDPAAACKELMRVAKRGFIETPSPITEYLGGHPTHRWIVYLEDVPGQGTTLVFRRRPFVRAPFRYALRSQWFADRDYHFHAEWQFRNVVYTQLVWENEFPFRVEETPGFDYDDPIQAAMSHLDSAMCGLRFGSIPSEILLADADSAIGFRPDWGLAHNVRGCILWNGGNPAAALEAFREAARLEPNDPTFRHNASMQIGSGSPQLNIPPTGDEDKVLLENFAGKVFHAFVGYDEYLANDLKIQPGERVLDVGGGQRPLKRADVSIDLDVEDGLHRQGQIISREKPLVCGNVEDLPFADNAFDVVCCRMVLEHVLDPIKACNELKRVAKRGFLETPNLFWEAFYGHPTHRWIVTWEAPTRTLVFTRKPFERIPFKSAILPVLLTQGDIQHNFEVNYRNITATQIEWDEANPFNVRVDDDGTTVFDYLGNPEHATNANLHYVRDLLSQGVPQIAEAEEAIRDAPLPMQREEGIQLRLQIARAMNDMATIQRLQTLRATGVVTQTKAKTKGAFVWTAPLRDPSGYADEARHFLFALHKAGVPTAARELRWSNKVTALTRDREQILNEMLATPNPANAISVSHILGSMMQRDPNSHICIGRTMFETDRIPADWAHNCNQMDAIWVPSEFNKETFTFSGVAPEKLRVVPGAIDLAPYNPNCAPLMLEGTRGFNFLSVFDWTLRKGWDVMLRGYIDAFSQHDDVALIIKTHSSMGYTTEQIGDMIGDYITNILGRDMNTIPDIILQDNNVPDFRMPNLYRAADCYVMPSRGEGWGRPYMEAMAMALPVIATNWSGQTAFTTPETALLLDYNLVDVPEVGWRETPTYKGHRWAEPSLAHLKTLMRQAYEDRAAGREMGLRARAHLEKHFTYEPVAQILINEWTRLQ